jgi:hypothetical protein
MYDSHDLQLCTIMILMVFIYVYYGLFAYTNLVDVMPLFSTVFSFHLPIFGKIHPVSGKIHPEIAPMNFGKSHRFIGEVGRLITKTGRISVFQICPSSLVLFG